MSNELQVTTAKALFAREDVKQKFQELLGKRAASFITSVLQITTQNALLAKADPTSIYHSAAVAATLDLPLNNNLGFAYIVPYNAKQPDGTYKQVAQFQMGYKGFIQLAQRSGQVRKIYATHICEGELISSNPLTGYEFDFTKRSSDTIVGYAARIELLNGFESVLYMPIEELKKHGTKYSQTFKKGFGLWKDDFDAMAKKTVLKLLISKYSPLSIEMQKAVVVDQAIVNDEAGNDLTYIDHEEVEINKEAERISLMIGDAKTLEDLNAIAEHVSESQIELFTNKKEELIKKKKAA